MRGLVALLRIETLAFLADRKVAVLGATHQLLLAGGQILLWSSLLATGSVEAACGPVTQREMITYVLLATSLSGLADFRIVDTINERVVRGQAAIDVLRPVGFPALIFTRELARFVLGFALQAVPVLAVLGLLCGFVVPGLERILATLLLVLGGWTVAALLGWCVGVAALRLFDTTQVKYAFQGLAALLSGALVPLWFFPQPLCAVAERLPFHLLFHAPLSVWLGRAGPEDALGYAISLALWLCVLGIAAGAAWRWARASMVVQGG